MKRGTLHVAIHGNILDPNEWSGTGYYCYHSLATKYAKCHPSALNRFSRSYKLSRLIYNILCCLKYFRKTGGFQYSEFSLATLWRPIRLNHDDAVLTLYQLLPSSIVSRSDIKTYHYIDLTLKQVFDYYHCFTSIPLSIKNKILYREKLGYNKAAAVFAHSRFAAKSLIIDYNLNPDKVFVVPPGANINEERRLSIIDKRRQRLSQPTENKLNLLFIGKDIYRKGLDRLISAIDKTSLSSYIAIALVGPHDTNLQLPHYVTNYGFLDKDNDHSLLSSIYIHCDFGVLLSRQEAGGMSLLEFSSLGIPTISTMTGGMSEHVNMQANINTSDHNGIYRPVKLERFLSAVVKKTSITKELQMRALENAHQYTWSISVKSLLSLMDLS